MINISLFRNQTGQLTGFSVSGHAGYAEAGADIVCASVTTAAFTAVNGLTDVIGIETEVTMQEGYLSCKMPEALAREKRQMADVLLESMVLSFQNIAEQYGAYVSLETKRI